MDPITAVGTAGELAGVLWQLVKQIRQLVEAAKGARQALIDLARRMERMRLLLNEFKSLAQRLENSDHRGILLSFDDIGCRETLGQLQTLVNKLSLEAGVHQMWMKVNWIWHKEDAAKLLSRLAAHESDLSSALQFIAA